MKKLVLLMALALSAVSLTACSPTTPAREGLNIVATTTQVTEFTQAIIGDTGTVTGLIQPNQSAHSFDPSAKQLLAISQADAIVMNGANLEPWLADALAAANFDGLIINATLGIPLIDQDPHVWTSPALALSMVSNIASNLIDLTGEESGGPLEWNAVDYEKKLMALDEWTKANFDQVPAEQRLLVTNHDAFTYFVDAYDITFIGSIIPSFDDNAEPSAAELDQLIADIEQSGATAIFSEASISPKLAKTIASEAGVTVYSGEDALYSDSLGVAGSSGETYIKATIHNVTMLMTSWGYPVLPLPAEIAE